MSDPSKPPMAGEINLPTTPQRISEVEGEAELGQRYLVPCIYTPPDMDIPKELLGTWVPVIGPRHEDTMYIGFELYHYHYDFRFMNTEQWLMFIGGNTMIVNHHHASVLIAHGAYELKLEERPMVMQRPMTEFPVWNHIVPALEKAYKGCELIDGHICPHKGVSLRGTPLHNGLLVCPAHGLAFNPTTGKQADRMDKAFSEAIMEANKHKKR